MADVKGFSLNVLRESLLKCRGDSSATRARIKRLKQEVTEVMSRITEQDRQNNGISNEINKMKVSRQDLLKQIDDRTQQLDDITSKNSNFVKDKVLVPADEGIEAAKTAIGVFEEMKDAGMMLQRMLRRENPDKTEASTNVNLPYTHKYDEEADLFYEVLKSEELLFALQKELREVKDIARGGKIKKGSPYASITKSEWDAKLDNILRLEDEAKELEKELEALEEDEKRRETEDEARRREIESSLEKGVGDSGDSAADIVARALASTDNSNVDMAESEEFFAPSGPAATQVGETTVRRADDDEDEDMPYQSVYARGSD